MHAGGQVRQPKATVGAVDLGGSSLEVSFVPDDPQTAEAQGRLIAEQSIDSLSCLVTVCLYWLLLSSLHGYIYG